MVKRLLLFFRTRKYELLLAALIQHLFVGIILPNQLIYFEFIWPLNMTVLGVASTGVFLEKGRVRRVIRTVLSLVVLALTLASPIMATNHFMMGLSIVYVLFFGYIFWEIIKFLAQPSYIDVDVILASACGYLLLIEISTFFFQSLYYRDPASFNGIDISNGTITYIDFVYFSSITLTSIGYGDITPNMYYTKLATALIGIVGQFYSVVLVGILISKFSSRTEAAEREQSREEPPRRPDSNGTSTNKIDINV